MGEDSAKNSKFKQPLTIFLLTMELNNNFAHE